MARTDSMARVLAEASIGRTRARLALGVLTSDMAGDPFFPLQSTTIARRLRKSCNTCNCSPLPGCSEAPKRQDECGSVDLGGRSAVVSNRRHPGVGDHQTLQCSERVHTVLCRGGEVAADREPRRVYNHQRRCAKVKGLELSASTLRMRGSQCFDQVLSKDFPVAAFGSTPTHRQPGWSLQLTGLRPSPTRARANKTSEYAALLADLQHHARNRFRSLHEVPLNRRWACRPWWGAFDLGLSFALELELSPNQWCTTL
jgi:hypothetical protein